MTPLGSTESYPVDFRVICATHQLRQAVAEKRFRDDLYYRINGLTLFLPALRERKDIPSLVQTLLSELASDTSVAISSDVQALFGRHTWPGNIRQLQNVLRVALALSAQRTVYKQHLPDDFFLDLDQNAVLPVKEKRDHTPSNDQSHWRESLPSLYSSTDGNITRIAEISGVSRNTVYKRLRSLGLK